MKKHIFQDGDLSYSFNLEGGAWDERQTATLVRVGSDWTPPYQGKPSCQATSNGNELKVTIFRQLGKRATKLKLDYGEAFDLAILLMEYTKSDPYAKKPLYTSRRAKKC